MSRIIITIRCRRERLRFPVTYRNLSPATNKFDSYVHGCLHKGKYILTSQCHRSAIPIQALNSKEVFKMSP